MLRSDHSAFFSPRPSAPRTLFWVVGFAAMALAAGCSPKIGDKCTVSTDCSATGDRLCDITEPGGYCTVFNCEPDGCPDDAACINFGTTLSNVTQVVNGMTTIAPACTAGQGDSPYQRSFCMASCETDSDCRGGYKCVEPSDVGGVKADYYRSNKVCAVPRSGPLPVLSDGGANVQVCLGSDAGLAPDAGSAGASGSGGTAGAGAAGESAGGMSGADNAGAGG